MTGYPKLSVVGPFPPPVHGAAAVTQNIAEAMKSSVRVERLAISPADGLRGFAYHASRLIRVLVAAASLAGGRGPVYLSAAGGFGLGYNVLLAGLARLLRRPLFVHHHSFAYLDQWNRLASLLVRASGRKAIHICLCPCMSQRLRQRYQPAHTVVVSNAAFFTPADMDGKESNDGVIRIGHLSNLSIDKGLDLTIDLADSLKRRGISVELVLAGPLADRGTESLMRVARDRLGASLVELGPLYGHDKRRFFDRVDLFIFPTRYANEAEPLVIYEAMAHGLPVIAFARGCIADQVGDSGLTIEPNDNFVVHAADKIVGWAKDRTALSAARTATHRRSRDLHIEASRQLADLLGRLRAAVA